MKLQKENPAGCGGEGKQSKENLETRKGRFIPSDEVKRRRCEVKGKVCEVKGKVCEVR